MLNEMLKNLISAKITRYAKLISLDISDRKLSITLLLNGETLPINLTLGDCKLIQKDNKTLFFPTKIKADREWLHNLLIDNAKLLIIELPQEFVIIAKKLLKG